ncbi:MAG: response regulator [Pseudobdellovibrionaceae bacterium]
MAQALNVLLVDDDELVLGTLEDMLADLGHHVITANDGDKALKKLSEKSFDLLITDVIMPVKEGIETVSEVRRLYPGIKIIAMSGGGRTKNYDFLNLALKIGANAALQKPFHAKDLREAIEKSGV